MRNPLFWPKHMTLIDKLQRLELLAPERVKAIEVLVDVALRDVWPDPKRYAAKYRRVHVEKGGA